MKAIIDADSFIYRSALNCEELVQYDATHYGIQYNTSKGIEYLNNFVQETLEALNLKEYILVVGGTGKNFRLDINPKYKSNRKQQKKPIMLDIIRGIVFNEFPVAYIPRLEADDTCRILVEEDKNNVLVSIDKDLRTFESKIYNPDKKDMRYVSKAQADIAFKKQLLTGDKCDGYDGLYGVGPKTAEKLLLDGITIEGILDLFLEKGYLQEDFERVYNCAQILGKEDYRDGTITLYGGKTIKVTDN